MSTPYVTPAVLLNQPTGISWGTLPAPRSSTDAQLAAQLDVCWTASALVDNFCQQTLRADAVTETYSGPDMGFVNVNAAGNGIVNLRRWPVLQVLNVQVAAATAFPRVWQSVPTGQWDLIQSMVPLYGSSVGGASAFGPSILEFAPGFVDWTWGRDAFRVQVSYESGWPHTSLTSLVYGGNQSLPVDDVAGAVGAIMQMYDGAQTETCTVTSATATNGLGYGPGTLELASPLLYDHQVGTLFTALPHDVIWATTLFAVYEALTRGASATTTQALPGSGTGSPQTGKAGIQSNAQKYLAPYRIVV